MRLSELPAEQPVGRPSDNPATGAHQHWAASPNDRGPPARNRNASDRTVGMWRLVHCQGHRSVTRSRHVRAHSAQLNLRGLCVEPPFDPSWAILPLQEGGYEIQLRILAVVHGRPADAECNFNNELNRAQMEGLPNVESY